MVSHSDPLSPDTSGSVSALGFPEAAPHTEGGAWMEEGRAVPTLPPGTGPEEARSARLTLRV